MPYWALKICLFQTEKETLELPLLSRIGYLVFTAFNQRVAFYLVWVFTDLACNASGLGFNGYDENGSAKWDLLTNFKFFEFEVRVLFQENSNFSQLNLKFCNSLKVFHKSENSDWLMEYADGRMAQIRMLRSTRKISNIFCVFTELFMAWF